MKDKLSGMVNGQQVNWGMVENFLCGVSSPPTRHFCFGKSAQNHFCLCAALRVPPPPSRIRVRARITSLVWVVSRLSGKARGLRILRVWKGRATPPDRMDRRPNKGSYSCANPKMARELAPLKQPSPEGSIRDGGSAAPNAGNQGMN